MDFLNHPIELFGYAASVLVFITFCMKTMVWLRAVAIASNLAFIAYGLGAQLLPILILHGVMLPLNLLRLKEHLWLVRQVRHAVTENPTVEALLPFMHLLKIETGQTIFKKGDPADRLYYVQSGHVLIVEFDKHLREGDIFGEIGLFSEGSLRSATARAMEGSQICEIDRGTVFKIYREHPEFGIAITRLVTDRLIENQNQLLERIAESDTKRRAENEQDASRTPSSETPLMPLR